jgi:hypothetical protein
MLAGAGLAGLALFAAMNYLNDGRQTTSVAAGSAPASSQESAAYGTEVVLHKGDENLAAGKLIGDLSRIGCEGLTADAAVLDPKTWGVVTLYQRNVKLIPAAQKEAEEVGPETAAAVAQSLKVGDQTCGAAGQQFATK